MPNAVLAGVLATVARTSSAAAWVVWTAAGVVLAVHWLVFTAKTIVSAATSPESRQNH